MTDRLWIENFTKSFLLVCCCQFVYLVLAGCYMASHPPSYSHTHTPIHQKLCNYKLQEGPSLHFSVRPFQRSQFRLVSTHFTKYACTPTPRPTTILKLLWSHPSTLENRHRTAVASPQTESTLTRQRTTPNTHWYFLLKSTQPFHSTAKLHNWV